MLDEAAGEGGAAEQHRVLPAEAAPVELGEVIAHDHRRLHEQSAHADGVRAVGLGRLDDRVDGLLDAEVHDPVPVVRDDDVDEVLADVVDVAPDRGEHEGALVDAADGVHVRLEVGDSPLHRLGRGEDEGQLHAA